jgi:chaperonin GroES
MKFRPLHDRVVVKRIDAEEKSAGGIIIPDTAKEKPSQGEIIAVGPGGRDEAGKLIPIDLKVGDIVLFGKWSGTEVKLDGEDLLIMKESDVMGVIEGGAAKHKKAVSHSSIIQKKEFRPWLQKTLNFPSTLATACCVASISWPTL